MYTLKKAIALLTPNERRRGLSVLMLVMGMAFLETIGMASIMPFMALLGNVKLLDTNPILNKLFNLAKNFGVYSPESFLLALGFGAFVIIIISAVYRTITHYVMNRYIEMCRHSISTRLLESYLHQPYVFFLNRHSSDMSKNILSEVDQYIGKVFRPAYSMFAYSLVLLAIIILLIIVNPWLAVMALCLLGGLYSMAFLGLKHKLKHLGGILVNADRERFMVASEAFGGIKDIKLLGCEQSYVNRFSAPSKQFSLIHANHHTLNQVPHFLIEALIFGAILVLTIVLMISAGGLGSDAFGQVFPILGLYAFSSLRMKPAVHQIYEGFASLRYGQAAVDNLSSDLYYSKCAEQHFKDSPPMIKAKNTIALKHLSYTYSKAVKPTLIDLNIEITVGSTVGLIGSTGAGKTTLVDIILGLLRPTQGFLAIDGIEITDESLRGWQQSLGYVPQDIYLTDMTVGENIALGVPKEKIDYDQVVRCARMAQLHNFIIGDLPAKYDTQVGERGVRLSGGQRQRIGIARALYHNPEVLVFDEATSALDSVSENAVIKAIETLAYKKTIIIIAHRLLTMKNCDEIIHLEQGRIKNRGTYSDLIDNNIEFRVMLGTMAR